MNQKLNRQGKKTGSFSFDRIFTGIFLRDYPSRYAAVTELAGMEVAFTVVTGVDVVEQIMTAAFVIPLQGNWTAHASGRKAGRLSHPRSRLGNGIQGSV
jgi:hypothetical protein